MTISGIEFFDKLPNNFEDLPNAETLSTKDWNVYKNSSYTTAVQKFNTLNDILSMNIKGLDLEMAKFPRVKYTQKKIAEQKILPSKILAR